jgi:hypothetical protein
VGRPPGGRFVDIRENPGPMGFILIGTLGIIVAVGLGAWGRRCTPDHRFQQGRAGLLAGLGAFFVLIGIVRELTVH